jgi:hypothetical protein
MEMDGHVVDRRFLAVATGAGAALPWPVATSSTARPARRSVVSHNGSPTMRSCDPIAAWLPRTHFARCAFLIPSRSAKGPAPSGQRRGRSGRCGSTRRPGRRRGRRG